MKNITTVRDIVSYWPTMSAFARDISTDADTVPVSRVYRWVERNRILGKYEARVLDAASRRGIKLTQARLDGIQSRG